MNTDGKKREVIDLNGRGEQAELRFFIFFMPVWLLIFPHLALLQVKLALPLFIGSIFCFYNFRRLTRNRLVFEDQSLCLPGVTPTSYSFSEVETLTLQDNQLIFKGVGAGARFERKVNIAGLSQENARRLWSLISRSLKGTKITREVRERLTSQRQEEPQAQIAASERDIKILLDLSRSRERDSLLDYGENYWNTFFRSWPVIWFSLAFVLYAAALVFILSQGHNHWTANDLAYFLQYFLGKIILSTLSVPVLVQFQRVMIFIFANGFGCAGFLLLFSYLLHYLIRKSTAIDRVFIDYLGVTSQARTPTGIIPVAFIPWKKIKAIRVKQKSGGSIIEMVSERAVIEIPARAIPRNVDREALQEALQYWAKSARVEPKVLEVLSPRESTYTDLWLSSLASAPKLNELTALEPGSSLSDHPYRVDKILASGGQGISYLASRIEKEEAEQSGAVKVNLTQLFVLKETILPVYVNESARKKALSRFEQAAEILKGLEHENVVKLVEYFTEAQRAYLVLEYIEGESLEDNVAKGGPWQESRVKAIALKLLAILEYLHGRTPPVVHRDFTPDNLILTGAEVKLIDFGVAIVEEENEASHLLINSMVGKRGYMPKEQFRGKATPRSDIWALGACLYFLLTGEPPEPLSEAHPKLKRLTVSDGFDAIIARATKEEEADRYQSAGEMAEDIIALDGDHE